MLYRCQFYARLRPITFDYFRLLFFVAYNILYKDRFLPTSILRPNAYADFIFLVVIHFINFYIFLSPYSFYEKMLTLVTICTIFQFFLVNFNFKKMNKANILCLSGSEWHARVGMDEITSDAIERNLTELINNLFLIFF